MSHAKSPHPSRLVPLLLCLLAAATACQITIPEGRLPCDGDSQCPSGWMCLDGHCHTPRGAEPLPDAGSASAPDTGTAQTELPAPELDAGVAADAAAADGGGDALPVVGQSCSEPLAKACNGNERLDKLVCLDGTWHWSGTCDRDARCDLRPGPTHGTCQPSLAACKGRAPGAMTCEGVERKRCSEDLLSASPEPCAANMHCRDGAAVSCECDPGFEPDAAGGCKKDACPMGYLRSDRGCEDVDECAVDNGGCGAHRDCKNQDGSFSCGACTLGYADVAGACTDVNECATDNGGCGAHRACNNSDGAFGCGTCDAGYADVAGACMDIDECATNNGGCSHRSCNNTPGSFSCGACESGYAISGSSACADINECATNNGGCGHRSCTNTPGSFSCGACDGGYQLDMAGTSCVDINECLTSNGGCGVHRACNNSEGGFSCGACDGGYQLDAAGTSCVDINECTNGTAQCDFGCINTDGGFRCKILIDPCLALAPSAPGLIPVPCVAQ